MDEIIYNALTGYYHTLSKLGSYSYKEVYRLLLLCFYRDFVFGYYGRALSKEEYRDIERALYCLFGSNCLIPYPDYLKMGKLHIGIIAEIVKRLKAVEDANVLKAGEGFDEESDVVVVAEEQ